MGSSISTSRNSSSSHTFTPHDLLSNQCQPILQEQMVRDRPLDADVYTYYDHVDVIGQGSNGVVSRIKKKNMRVVREANTKVLADFFGMEGNGEGYKPLPPPPPSSSKTQLYALKTIDYDYVSDQSIDELRNEIAILRRLDHPNICRLYDVFERRGNVATVMELCTGGDLYTRTPYKEDEAADVICQLCSALRYLHDRGFIHCDLKFENIMFESPHPEARIRLIDFGLSKHVGTKDQWATGSSGTIYTMAPEVFDAEYTSQTDMWSLGVLAFMLLSNKMPFWGKSVLHVMERIVECDYNFDDETWSHVSPHAKDFVSSLINVDPESRLDAKESLKTPWLSSYIYRSSRQQKCELWDEEMRRGMRRYAMEETRFKKWVLMIMAYTSPSVEDKEGEEEGGRRLFRYFDALERDGMIGFAEFRRLWMMTTGGGGGEYNFSDDDDDDSGDDDWRRPMSREWEKEVKTIFRGIDMNADGWIHYSEFMASTLESRAAAADGGSGVIDEDKIEDAFEFIDFDRTGYISKHNFKTLLGQCGTDKIVDKLFNEVDVNRKGFISYNDFCQLFRNSATTTQHHQQQKHQYTTTTTQFHDSDNNTVTTTTSNNDDYYRQ